VSSHLLGGGEKNNQEIEKGKPELSPGLAHNLLALVKRGGHFRKKRERHFISRRERPPYVLKKNGAGG